MSAHMEKVVQYHSSVKPPWVGTVSGNGRRSKATRHEVWLNASPCLASQSWKAIWFRGPREHTTACCPLAAVALAEEQPRVPSNISARYTLIKRDGGRG
ncbi:uncharacterized protein MYCFIDRAFT_178765 [Pseudocercospora fijiensis CIRAD86]|uniref:Uncharacterized protein n=1 Tax=Pseudocercospora fijiensis (strain CIRAD86) TaxID=383855 RepID=M3AMF7_PSEFD|nr:uncharacterized protein MYCFIDRAFT_178765 [Pseudocercospora fijiensis CIRAD86]EME78647.1 hypothetical protein MYCFIDRAFT_178765 [Pseudocercospora fijiensis CIRAD86]